MSTQPEALRLADALEVVSVFGPLNAMRLEDAAAELRRLHAENERFAALVCDYAAEEAPDAIRKIAVDRDRWHTKAQRAEAQRDALLGLLKEARKIAPASSSRNLAKDWDQRTTAAIRAAEEGK